MKNKLIKEDIQKFTKYRNLLKEFNDIKTFFNYIKQQLTFWKSAPSDMIQDVKDRINEAIVENINEFRKLNFSIGEREELLGSKIIQFLETYSNPGKINNPDIMNQGIDEIEQLMKKVTLNAQQAIKDVNPNLKDTSQQELKDAKDLLEDYKVFKQNLDQIRELVKYIREIGSNKQLVIETIQEYLEAIQQIEFVEDFYNSKEIIMEFLIDNSNSKTFYVPSVFYKRIDEVVRPALITNGRRIKARMMELKQKIQDLESDIHSLSENKKKK